MATTSKSRRWKPFLGLRTRHPKNLPATFIQDHIESDLSPDITSPPRRYTSEISAFAKPEKKQEIRSQEKSLFSVASTELQALKNAIVQYQIKTKPDPQTVIDLNVNNCTWNNVQEAVKVAAREEGSDDESSIARTCCSTIIANLPAFETWLDLLPSGDYGAVVCGLFKMVVVAAKRANEVRVAVFKALASIPENIARAAEYRELYAESRPLVLMQKTAQLCSAVLVALRHLLMYFTEGTLKRGFKAIVQGPAYKKTLQAHLDSINDLTKDINQEANVRSQHRLKDVENNVVVLRKELRELQSSIQSSKVDEAWKKAMKSRIGDIIAERVLNTLLSHFSSNSCIGGGMTWSADAPCLLGSYESPASAETMRRTPIVNKEILLALLGASQDVHLQDVQRCLAQGRSLEAYDQDRVKWIMSSKQVRAWLKHPKSRVLLINGNGDEHETFGPTSFLAALILDSLEDIEPIITLHFFCSLHITTQEGIADDAIGIMKSLIVQILLSSMDWDLSALNAYDTQQLGISELEALCGLLRLLVKQMPPMTLLYLIIDGITLYERTQRCQSFLKAIKEVINIMDDCPQLVMKLLLTCHGRSSFVRDYVDREDTLTVPADVDGDCQGGSEHTWKGGIGRDVKGFGDATANDAS